MKCLVCGKELQTAVATQQGGEWVTTYTPWSNEEIDVLMQCCNECTHEHVPKDKQVLPDIYAASEIYRVMYAQDRQNIVLKRIKENILKKPNVSHVVAIDMLNALKLKAYLERWDEFGAIYVMELNQKENNHVRDTAHMYRFGSRNPNDFMWLARLVNGTPKKTGPNAGLSTVYWQRTVALASHGKAVSAIAWLNGLSSYDLARLEKRT